MATKTYHDEELECTVDVIAMTKTEAIEYAIDWIENIEVAGCQTDMSVYVEYKDGRFYHNIDGDITGTFRKTNIKAIILDDGYGYYIYGAYKMNDNLIPEPA